jgi:hypothetical protein
MKLFALPLNVDLSGDGFCRESQLTIKLFFQRFIAINLRLSFRLTCIVIDRPRASDDASFSPIYRAGFTSCPTSLSPTQSLSIRTACTSRRTRRSHTNV